MARILVAYASRHGQTEKISDRIAARLRSLGHDVALHDLRERPLVPGLAAADAVVLGASVQMGRHLREAVRFARDNHLLLGRMPGVFFSVSMSSARNRPEDRRAADDYVAGFHHDTGWQPALVAKLAGALAYRRYGFLMRWFMRRVSQRTGGDTDTSRDHEYTSWSQVDDLADELAALLPAAGATAKIVPPAVSDAKILRA